MKELGLLRMEPVGNALFCAWDRKSSAAKTLAGLLDTSGCAGKDDLIYASLKSWGAGLARSAPAADRLPLEETLAYGVELARRDPDVAQVWPVVLAKNRSRVNLARLEQLCRRIGEKRALGFLLSLTGMLLLDSTVLEFAKRLRDSRVRKAQDFFKGSRGSRSRQLSESNTPRVAKRWHFRMNTRFESFQSHFDKFVSRP